MSICDPQRRVLVVEHDDLLARVLGRYLAAAGAQVTVATGVAEATPLVLAAEHTALVTEAHLHDGDGLTLAALMRTARPDARIVVISGVEFDSWDLASRLQATLLVKPHVAPVVAALWPEPAADSRRFLRRGWAT